MDKPSWGDHLTGVMAVGHDKTGFGDRLKAIRTERQLTQGQLAERVGMLVQNVGRLESGGRTPSWETVLRLATALGVTPNAFLERQPG